MSLIRNDQMLLAKVDIILFHGSVLKFTLFRNRVTNILFYKQVMNPLRTKLYFPKAI